MKRIFYFLIASLIIILAVTGCNTASSTQESEAETVETLSGAVSYPVEIEDMNGTVTIEKKPERIVSLSPSNTETLFALDVGNRVVGRTDYDNYPQEAQSVPSIGSYASPSVERILAQAPDLVVASDFIDDSIKSQLEATGAKVLVFSPTTVSDVEKYIVSLGQAVNANDKAASVVDGMKSELSEVSQKVSDITEKKTVFIDLGDFYSVGPGSLLNDELELINAQNIAADSESPYPQLSAETIVDDNPDVYFSFMKSVDELKKTSGFDTIKAFEDNAVYYYPDNAPEGDIIKRPGPRVVEGLKLLAKDIYPDKFADE